MNITYFHANHYQDVSTYVNAFYFNINLIGWKEKQCWSFRPDFRLSSVLKPAPNKFGLEAQKVNSSGLAPMWGSNCAKKIVTEID
jgi:hypothetical protein